MYLQWHLQFTYIQKVFCTHSSWLAESLPQSQVTFLSLQPPAHPSQHYHCCHGDHLLSGRQRGWGQCGCYTSSKRLSKWQWGRRYHRACLQETAKHQVWEERDKLITKELVYILHKVKRRVTHKDCEGTMLAGLKQHSLYELQNFCIVYWEWG